MHASRPIGCSGVLVHPVGLGAMPLSIEGRPGRAEAVGVIRAALDAGMDLVDTADCYCLGEAEIGHNERLVAEAVTGWNGGRDILVATKGGVTRPGGGWLHDGRPEHLSRACEASLAALRTDAIGLYYLHAVDRHVPIEESVGALARLRDQGKIRHVGLSNVGVGEMERAEAIVPIAAVQNAAGPYDPSGLDDGVLARCEAGGIAFVAHSPMGGWRAGRIAHEPVLRTIGSAHGITPHQVVLAWLLACSPSLIPIPGASRERNAVGSAASASIDLAPEEVAILDATFRHRGPPAAV